MFLVVLVMFGQQVSRTGIAGVRRLKFMLVNRFLILRDQKERYDAGTQHEHDGDVNGNFCGKAERGYESKKIPAVPVNDYLGLTVVSHRKGPISCRYALRSSHILYGSLSRRPIENIGQDRPSIRFFTHPAGCVPSSPIFRSKPAVWH